MRAAVITVSNPFRPELNRRVAAVTRRRRVRALAPRGGQPTIALLNGRPILRAEWGRRLADGDVLAFVALPQGGGGGSNPLKIVLMLAVAWVAPYAAGGLNAALGLGLGATGISVLSAGIVIAGNVLINTLIPPPRLPSPQQAAALAAPSPTYSLNAQGNMARLDAAIPVIYGRHVIYPDFAAQPYVEYAGNEQFLYQLHCIGQGSHSVETIRIDDTVIESAVVQDGAVHRATGAFEEIDYQVVEPGGSVTLFPSNVVTSAEVSGQELLTSTYVGPFVLNAAGTTINTIAIDFVMPRGLYYAETDGRLTTKSVAATVEARLIDSSGAPLGAYAVIGYLAYSAATTTPQRQSLKYPVTAGRYEVRVVRTDTKDTSTQAGHELLWGSARGYLPGSQSYGNITLLALRMRATNNLSAQASRKINTVVTRKLPAWNGSSWGAAATTRSIAWALADIARADYGGGRADSRIDLDGLLALDAIWSARGDSFDGVFDSSQTIWEALQSVAKAGRAIPVDQGGVLHVVRDGAETLPRGMFTTRNIVRGSMSLDYTLPSDETADAIDVEYFDASVWQPRTVRAALPLSSETTVAKVKLFGVTSRNQAWREGMYLAAANRYRRRHVTFTTEMEGLIVTLGDLIVIQHDMPSWGQSGEVADYDGVYTVTTTEPPDFSAGGTHVIAFRKRDGSVDGPYTATATATPTVITIDSPTLHIYAGGAAERTHYAFGPADAQYIEARVVGVRPRSDNQVEIAAVIESDFVHTAETGTVPTESAWQLATRITRPVLTGLIARSSPDAADFMFISWQASAGAEYYLIEVSDSGNGYTRIGETRGTTFTATAAYGARTILRVCPVGLVQGEWVEIAYGSSASYMWDAVDTTLMWDTTTAPGDGSAVQMWRY